VTWYTQKSKPCGVLCFMIVKCKHNFDVQIPTWNYWGVCVWKQLTFRISHAYPIWKHTFVFFIFQFLFYALVVNKKIIINDLTYNCNYEEWNIKIYLKIILLLFLTLQQVSNKIIQYFPLLLGWTCIPPNITLSSNT
jgi:hypothetical protein